MSKQNQTLKQPKVTQVSLLTITTDTATFQFRDEDLTEHHVGELRSQLRPREPLDPLTLWQCPDTNALIILDGHHSFEAYKRFGWSAKVPARVHTYSLKDARKLAVTENAKARLPITPQERKNAAWRLVDTHECGKPVYTKSEIVELRLACDGTIAKMRATRRKLIEQGLSVPDTWADACQLLKDAAQRDEDWDPDEWVQTRADALDALVGKRIGFEGEQCLDAVRIMLEKRLGHRAEELADYWSTVPDGDEALPF